MGMSKCEIVPENGGSEWWLWEFGEYPRSSVLAGQYRQARIECYESEAEAREDNPGVPVRSDGTVNHRMAAPLMPSCDPYPGLTAGAGERWDDEY